MCNQGLMSSVPQAFDLPASPRLPNEVVYMLLRFMSLDSLLTLRLLNRHWNRLVSSYLPNSALPVIRIKNGWYQITKINNILKTIDERIQDQIPFSNYNITVVEGLAMVEFFRKVGPFIKVATLDFTFSNFCLLSIVETMPNVEVLTVHVGPGTRNVGKSLLGFLTQKSCSLQKLRALYVQCYEISLAGTCSQSLKGLPSMTGTIPCLRTLQLNFVLTESVKTLIQFLNKFPNLKVASLSLRIEPSVDVMGITIGDNLRKWIHPRLFQKLIINIQLTSAVRGLVEFLGHAFKLSSVIALREGFLEPTPFGCQPHMERLVFGQLGPATCQHMFSLNPPDNLLKLEIVHLSFRRWGIGKNAHTNLQPYSTVTELELIGNGSFDFSGQPVVPYKSLFPNLQYLGLVAKLKPFHLQYIDDNYANLTKLMIRVPRQKTDISDYENAISFNALFEVEGCLGLSWRLSKLEGLKTLILAGRYITAVVKKIVELSASERFPRLDLLCFYIGGQQYTPQIITLFENMRGLKKVQFLYYSDPRLYDTIPPTIDRLGGKPPVHYSWEM